MAKDNLFLGMARGKVGDIVFYRQNGQQITRTRNRAPRNPRTNAQLVQRAIAATVQQMYSAGSAIFDHSFQGRSAGAENQRAFLSLNMRQLRLDIARDIEEGVTTAEAARARVSSPRGKVPVPYSYIISEGKYDQRLFYVDTTDWTKLPTPAENETVAAYATRNNIVAGDIYTIVAIASSTEPYFDDPDGNLLASTPRANFGFLRLTVDKDLTSDAPMEQLGDIFTVEGSTSSSIDGTTSIDDSITPADIVGNPDFTQGAIGVIRSRKDQDLRSNSSMVFKSSLGIIAPYITSVWGAGTVHVGDSDLILEGGDF